MDTSKIKEHMDVISADRKTVGKVDHVDTHVHLDKPAAEVTAHWAG